MPSKCLLSINYFEDSNNFATGLFFFIQNILKIIFICALCVMENFYFTFINYNPFYENELNLDILQLVDLLKENDVKWSFFNFLCNEFEFQSATCLVYYFFITLSQKLVYFSAFCRLLLFFFLLEKLKILCHFLYKSLFKVFKIVPFFSIWFKP